MLAPFSAPGQEHLERVEQTRGTSADQLWNDVSHRLREHLSDTTYATWFASARPGELRDDDFEASRYTAQGPFIKFRVKADQDTFRDMVSVYSGAK